jgi:phage tail-like protein
LGLNSPDGSLGGLILPKGMAIDPEGIVYLLGQDSPWIKRFDAANKNFAVIPGIGGTGTELRQFNAPSNIAIAGDNLYVADYGNRRVQVFNVRTLALLHVFGPLDASGRHVEANDAGVWEPADVTADSTSAYILDKRYGRVYRQRVGEDRLRVVVGNSAAADMWTRIAVDKQGSIYLLNPAVPQLAQYDKSGVFQNDVPDAGDIRDQFDQPSIRLDHKGRFCLPPSLARLCARQLPPMPPACESPLALCPPPPGKTSGDTGLVFDKQGNSAVVDPSEPAGPKLHSTSGTWISAPLDSQIFSCQWHRIQVEGLNLPSGTNVEFSTFSSPDKKPAAEILALADDQWNPRPKSRFSATGEMQTPDGVTQVKSQPQDVLIQSPMGQYLWLRTRLTSDGYATPQASTIRVHYPRNSYLRFLPAIYGRDDDGRRFLDCFLSIFQTEWDALGNRVRDIDRYFDPAAVPAGPFMDYLASWLAVPLEATWTSDQKRTFLRAMPKLLRTIGTMQGVRTYLRAYLQSMTNLASEQQPDYPQLLEGFRERKWLALRVPGADKSRGHGPMWSRSVMGRIQLDVFSREGETQLVSSGDPARDPFDVFAHRFRIFVPSCWIRTDMDERTFRRAADTVKPAHTAYDLHLVEPRFRVGVQSTIGMDTIVGELPAARLGCRHTTNDPPSAQPKHRLGYDTLLSAAKDSAELSLRPGTRIGLQARVV